MYIYIYISLYIYIYICISLLMVGVEPQQFVESRFTDRVLPGGAAASCRMRVHA